MVSACPEAAAPVASDPPAEARSQRLAKFKREQVVVDTLNRGVSVARDRGAGRSRAKSACGRSSGTPGLGSGGWLAACRTRPSPRIPVRGSSRSS